MSINEIKPGITRRSLLKRAGALLLLNSVVGHRVCGGVSQLRISACDWSIGKSSDLAAFDVAKKIGLEGIQVNLGNVSNNLHLREKSRQQLYLDKSKETGIAISSLAIAELNNVPYKEDPQTEIWVSDSIDVAKNLGVKVILLAFFHKNDLRGDEKGKLEVIRRLKAVAPKSERMGITLGIESYLSAQELMDIIQKVGSNAVKVYYDFRNSADAGYDVINEIKFLGKDAICELHIKENGFLLGKGTLDWRRIGETLMDIDYVGDGWMQIEGAIPKDADIVESYRYNLRYLKAIFGK
ncbi:MAG TPA: sugar phosphate isomerase/epimerase family protein [Chryseolinea sp.]|nr:sugar phosphate isomerase/epimerase family protein [Chryseolinea sp.]